MTANLHAIWLDDLAPGEGSTPLFDQLFAEVDDETRAVILRACADEHTEPRVWVDPSWLASIQSIGVREDKDFDIEAGLDAAMAETLALPPEERPVFATPKPRKKPAKKPAAKSPLAAQEAKLRTVRGRLADEFKTLGGNDTGAVNELGIAFVCLLGLLLAPVIVAVFG